MFAQTTPSNLVLQSSANSSALLQEGKKLYNDGKFDEAIKILEQAAKEFGERDKINQSMTLINLSLAYQQRDLKKAEEKIEDSWKILQAISGNSKDKLKLIASALEVKGRLQLTIGKPEEAFKIWKDAAKQFAEIGDKRGEIRSQINQSLALQELGLYREAFKMLLSPIRNLKTQGDSQEKAIAYRGMGNVIRIAGLVGDVKEREEIFCLTQDVQQTKEKKEISCIAQEDIKKNKINYVNYLDISRKFLKQSLDISQHLKLQQDIVEAHLTLGNTERADFYRTKDAFDRVVKNPKNRLGQQLSLLEESIKQYQKASEISKNSISETILPITSIQARLNRLSLLIDFKQRLPDIKSKIKYEDDNDLKKKELESKLNAKEEMANRLVKDEVEYLPKIQAKVKNQSAIYARINLAQNLIKLFTMGEFSNTQLIKQILDESVKQAHDLEYFRAEAFALGNLAELYENNKDWSLAEQKTRQALEITEKIQAPDIAYLWQWQIGRILENKKNSNVPGAIAAYKEATKTLKSLRQDLASLNNIDLPFSFRDSVVPLYRRLVSLLLPPTTNLISQTQENQLEQNNLSPIFDQNNLNDALQFFEDLQVLELENFLRCRLQDTVSVPIEQSTDKENTDTAFIYPILLSNPDRLEVLLKLPGKQPTRHTAYNVSQHEVEEAIVNLREVIKYDGNAKSTPKVFQEIYDWLFRSGVPQTTIETELETSTSTVKTLVFVLDSALRNIPLPALYDGKQYLIEKSYSIALNLVPQMLKSKPLQKQGLKVLAAGVSVENKDPELPEKENTVLKLDGVKTELEFFQSDDFKNKVTISRVLCNSQGSLDELEPQSKNSCDGGFTSEALEKEVKSQPFKVVHLATHGQFSSSPDETYINAYHERINIDNLSQLLRSREESRPEPIELLVLSACQTAEGDTRAVLGIAGVSVQVGARSTIGSLSLVYDDATPLLMKQFYTNLLTKDASVSEALREAQVSLKNQGKTPKSWSPFVLVGNWR